ncbi:phage portal protein [Marinobacterium sp. D7]|uniref:phage portal protein n=1 Tax=Marinobacterium ramblicola TaxID=2849041 RepID=UPI001C2DED96|nr:phage portal protein [Marinobacterium ramblicola]MBV1788620.1 phage portal protein [Marinobacterium ramblicola]
MEKPRVRIKNGLPVTAGATRPTFRNQAYEGATHGRRSAGIVAPASGPNRALNGSLSTLRNRSRHAFRNNPWIERAISRNVSNEVGTGITPLFASSNTAFNERMAAVWDAWTGYASVDRTLDFYGILALAARTRRITGEVFIRLRYMPVGSQQVPIALQVIEPDMVPSDHDRTRSNGNRIIAGKEFTRRGKLVAVWVYKEHPGDGFGYASTELVRIPAAQIIHHYLPLRPGQVRGEPDIVPALLRAHTYDSYEDAELKRKETRAPFTAFLQKEYQGEDGWKFDPISGEPIDEDQDVPEINAQPGTILTGLPGEKITLFDGDKTGDGYADYQRQQLLAIAAGAKSLYELMTGDWSNINDRIYRAMIQEYRREIEVAQDHLCIHQICERIASWFTDQAVLLGLVQAPGYSQHYTDYHLRDWRPQRWPHIHPTQDVEATVLEIENDLESLEAAVARRGYRAADVQRKNVEARQRKVELERKAGLDRKE